MITPLPFVSVIMPTHNRAAVLGQAIDSVLAQTHRYFELIVVDDGSADNTSALVNTYNDRRIRFLRTEQNRGAAAARNLGIESANYDIIAFLDSDDKWLPDFLETVVAKMMRCDEKTGVVYSAYLYCCGSEQRVMPGDDIGTKEGYLLPELMKKNFVTLQSSLVRRACLADCGGFDGSFICRHDWELWLRIAQKWHFAFVPQPLVSVNYSSGSISSDHRVKIAGWLPVIDKHIELFRKYPGILVGHLLEIASAFDYLHSDGEFKRMRRLVFRALRTRPFVDKKYLHLLLAAVLGRRIYSEYRRLKNRLFGRAQ